jgi:hypothetical protein
MAEDGKGETSTTSILFLAGAIGIGIWFLTVASDFADSGTSPVYAVFFFVPIFGVFLIVVVLAEVVKSLSGSSKNNTSGENYKNCPICGVANHLDRKNCGSCKNRLP